MEPPSDHSIGRPSPRLDKGKSKMSEYEDLNDNASTHSLDSESEGLDISIIQTARAKKALESANEKLCRSSREKNPISLFGYNDYMAYHYAYMIKVTSVREPETFSEAAIHTPPRWTGRTMVFSPRNRGGYRLPNRAHKVPRTFSSRGAQIGTAPAVLLYEPRTARNDRAVHDPVPGSLPTSGRRCLSITYPGHIPVQLTRASTNDSRTYEFRQPNYRASHSASPRPQSDPIGCDLLYDLLTEHPSP